MPAIEDATSSSGKVLQKAEKDGDVVPVDAMTSTVDEDKADLVSAMPGKAHVDDGVSLKMSEGEEPKSKKKKEKKDKKRKLKRTKKRKNTKRIRSIRIVTMKKCVKPSSLVSPCEQKRKSRKRC